ncbi:MAG: hypothetical protein OXE77_05575 [Flavobacteriaceae bacterium]|nr:hypothetical protein [Flavobacteriaceae bacterium]
MERLLANGNPYQKRSVTSLWSPYHQSHRAVERGLAKHSLEEQYHWIMDEKALKRRRHGGE